MKDTISVIIPAHNEEAYIGKCLRAVRHAAARMRPGTVEIIVVANRCTDRTEAVARRYGARVVHDESRCIAAVRNTGAAAARGHILVTIDADSCMTPDALREIRHMLHSGQYIGGGTRSRFDRMSPGILASGLYVAMHLVPVMVRSGAPLSGGMFWCYKADFDRIGGFDERFVSLEDMDFAVRLHRLGKQCGKRFGTLRRSFIVTSSRKFDTFGDWYLIRNRALTKRIFTGRDRQAADSFYYDVR